MRLLLAALLAAALLPARPDTLAVADAPPVVERLDTPRASRSGLPRGHTPASARMLARIQAADLGWVDDEWRCLERLWTRESNFRARAFNRTPVQTPSGPKHAGGIPQILGLDPSTPPLQQIERGLDYIAHRYGTPCGAWDAWQARDRVGTGWY